MPNYLVKPREPTVLSDKEHHEISSTNLLSSGMQNAHIIPEILDMERFDAALSKALSSFPLLAGRLVKPNTQDAPWTIRLTNSGVPVLLIDSDADEIVPTDLIAQTPLCLAEPIDVAGLINTEGESDEPLFRLTITRFTKLNSTSIGTSCSHVLFDVAGLLLFLRLLSQLYQGLGPIDPPPYYEPEAIRFTDWSLENPPKPPATLSCHDPPAPPPCQQPERKAPGTDFFTFRLTATQVVEIHDFVTKGTEDLRISRVDTVVGLLARCLSEVEPESKPIDTFSYLINHRGMGIYPANAVLNAIIWISIGRQVSRSVDAHDDVLACATEIRKSLGRLKDPKFIKGVAADIAKMLSQVAWNTKRGNRTVAKEGCLIVNSTWKFGWTSPHFGHPGKVRFHASHRPGPRYVKVMPPNPKFVDGAWVSREGGMEVTFEIPSNRRERFEELFEGYAASFGMTGSVEFLP